LDPNAYGKPAAALTVLRETVIGRELFDFALREYARRWKFKRPTPADFFRTMEDASGVIWTGSGAPGSTALVTSMWPSRTSAPIV
jgi:aminopeptidase N